MKLLVVHDKPRGELGGMNAFIGAQNALFAQAGWVVTELICTPDPQPGALHVEPSGRRMGYRAVRQLAALLTQARPDAAIVHSVYYALGPSALLWLQRQVPTVYVLHDVTPLCPRATRLTREGAVCQRVQGPRCVGSGCYRVGEQGRWLSDAYGLLMRALQTRAAQQVRTWVVPSGYMADLLAQHGIDARRVSVVPHFIGSAPIPDAPSITGRMLFAGRLVAEKGVSVLLDALAHLKSAHWTLHIAGEGPERAAIERRIALHGWADRVRICGILTPEALASEYAQASLVVMPSLIPESFGLVGLEAMRHARPVVGFASGGMSEWLRDGITGRVAEWGDSASLARAVDGLLAQPQHAQEMGMRGRDLAAHEFGAEAHLKRMRAVLDLAMAASGRQPPVRDSAQQHRNAQAGP